MRVDVDGLAAAVADPGGVDALADAVVVEVHGDGPLVDLAGIPAVVVGVDGWVGADVLDDTGAVAAAVLANPVAAVAAAVLLRGSETRSIGEGLVAESSTYAALQAGPEHAAWLATRRPVEPKPDPGPAVHVQRDGDALHVTLDRPHARNAYSAAMRDGLLDALAVAAADPATTVLLDGAGSCFCAGGDLAEFGTRPDVATAHLVRLRRSAGRALAAVADRATVVVHGPCVGAGVELPAFASTVVARPGTTFRLPEVAMGLVPGAGGTVGIPRRIGRHDALRLALTGAAIDVDEALALGLVDAVEDAT